MGQLDVAFKCTSKVCQQVFVAEYRQHHKSSFTSNNFCYDFIKISIPNQTVSSSFSPLIEKLSPDFVAIYHQTERAEAAELDRIAGVGYRKALEFLVKDYLIDKVPGDAEVIKKTMLGPCVKKIDDKRIKEVAERATWLGNDETHYVRKWIEKDMKDLKSLINLVVHYVDAELLYLDTISSMPK
ncbi:DUF4145 domain-containing protein [Hymenobacter sp. BRD67]|nr:DUF4145 domain-containing protein [Hymenobacter sp. BRD67]